MRYFSRSGLEVPVQRRGATEMRWGPLRHEAVLDMHNLRTQERTRTVVAWTAWCS